MKSSGCPLYDATEMLREAAQRQRIDLAILVAETSLWASPEFHRLLVAENGTGAFFPYHRRFKEGIGETLLPDEIADKNSYAKHAIMQAVGIPRGHQKGFDACHIWPLTSNDARYYTVLANLVLLPSALHGLADNTPAIRHALQFRSYELYGSHPVSEPTPTKPDGYPICWRDLPIPPRTAAAILAGRKAHTSILQS